MPLNKILYISYDGLTDPLGQSQILPYLLELSKKENKFHIISFEKREKYFSGRDAVNKLLQNSTIIWHPCFYTKTPPILSTIWDIYKLKYLIRALHKKEKFSIVHCRSYIPSLVGLWMKKKHAVKFIFDMRGFWADERVEGQIWNLHNPIYKAVFKYFKKKEVEFLSKADYTISLTETAKKEIHSWRNIANQPISIEVIPCCVDSNLFNPDTINDTVKNNYRNKLNIHDSDFILSYLGALGTWYLLDEMLIFFKELVKKKTNSKFLFITQENPDTILNACQKLGITHEKIIIQQAERNLVPTLLSLSNISIYFIKPSFSKKASSPTKNAEIMSMGIPIIYNSGIGDLDMQNKENMSIAIHKLNTIDYLKAIEQIGALKTDKLRNRAIDLFSLEKGITSYNKVYNLLNTIK